LIFKLNSKNMLSVTARARPGPVKVRVSSCEIIQAKHVIRSRLGYKYYIYVALIEIPPCMCRRYTYRWGDLLGIVSAAIEQVNTSIVDLIPGDHGAENVDRVTNVRRSNLDWGDIDRVLQVPVIRVRYITKQWPRRNLCCKVKVIIKRLK
jgi:hypothetical protein